MGVFASIANGFKFLASLVGWGAARDAAKNTPAMQANAAKKTDDVIDQKIAAANEQAAKGDLTEERKLASE